MNIVKKVESKYLKKTPELRPGDTVRVHQKIREGSKERIQIFEGVVLKIKGGGIKTTFLVRKISFGIGVEKNFLLNSPNIAKIEVRKRAKVRQAYLTYLRNLRGKKARLKDMQFDMLAVNTVEEPEDMPVDAEEESKDAQITELVEEEVGAKEVEEVSIDEVIKKENKEAAKEDMDESGQTEEGPAGSDDQANQIAEVEEGISKATKDLEAGGKDTEGQRAEAAKEDITQEELAQEIKEEKETT
jgi:large subunit ribosomal protein L19